ncbi:MAG: glycoside hydrolase family 43 protein [Arachidicoccus sp.]|nr:glycoside hydrolase family 43 protein [Arachidicoccus sp.]
MVVPMRRIAAIIQILVTGLIFTSCSSSAWIYTSFHEPANEGLRLLYSYDAYHWNDFGKIFLKPEIGNQKIMRDPSVVFGNDKTFHLVWTTEWKGGKGFGYASSSDLIHWSQEKYISVMADEPTVKNVWAPEIFYDDNTEQYIIIWASDVPFRFAKGTEDEDNNHRLYYVTTKDFHTFSNEKLFFDPGFSCIDATIIKRGKNDYVLVFKDNTRSNRNIKVAFANTLLGPYQGVSNAITPGYSEGPSVAHTGNNYLIYYDWYNHKSFGALMTKDFHSFRNITDKISIPKGHKHGTIIKVKKKLVQHVLKEVAIQD